MPVAGPGIVSRLVREPGAYRVEIHIGHAREQVTLRLDQGGLVTPLPQGAAALLDGVEIAHIAPAHRLHHLRQTIHRLRRGQQMKVVAHQDIGVQGDTKLRRAFMQQIQQHLIIRCAGENGLPVVAALDNVMGVTGQREPRKTGHR